MYAIRSYYASLKLQTGASEYAPGKSEIVKSEAIKALSTLEACREAIDAIDSELLALISLTDKSGVEEFARELAALGIEIP